MRFFWFLNFTATSSVMTDTPMFRACGAGGLCFGSGPVSHGVDFGRSLLLSISLEIAKVKIFPIRVSIRVNWPSLGRWSTLAGTGRTYRAGETKRRGRKFVPISPPGLRQPAFRCFAKGFFRKRVVS